MARLNVQIDAECDGYRNDVFSSFILRTRGYNSAKTLLQKLKMTSAMFGGKLIGVPFILKLRTKSTPISYNSPFYYVDLVLGCSLLEGIKLANETATMMADAGLDQVAFETAVEAGMANGPFEDTVEEMLEMEDLLLSSGSISEMDTQAAPMALSDEENTTVQAVPEPSDLGLDGLRLIIEGAKQEGLVTA